MILDLLIVAIYAGIVCLILGLTITSLGFSVIFGAIPGIITGIMKGFKNYFESFRDEVRFGK